MHAGSCYETDGRMRMNLALALALAAPSPGTADDAAPPADANLFVYREAVAPMLFKAGVEVDGRAIAELPNRGYTAVHLAPGLHSVVLRWPKLAMQAGDAIPVRITEGRSPPYALCPSRARRSCPGACSS